MTPSAKVSRFAPARQKIQVANTWRVWVQGDECYLGIRDAARSAKLSLHRNFNWQLRAGSALHRLKRPPRRPDNWVHALQLAFFIDPDAFRPVRSTFTPQWLLEIPVGQKLIVNVLFAPVAARDQCVLPRQFEGTIFAQLPLRTGKSVVLAAAGYTRNEQDNAFVKDVRSKLKITLSSRPPDESFFAEALWFESTPQGSNLVAIVPVGTDSIVVAW